MTTMANPAASSANTLFAGENLACVRAERLVFTGLSFRIAAGGALVLRGPNGSGKSSLLRLMAGLTRPETGHLQWGGSPVREDWGAHRARLHFIGHLDAIKPALSVGEMLEFWAGLRGDTSLVSAALAHFGLWRLETFPCRLLSAGQRKRLALSRLIATHVPLWLLDEPTTGLDAEAEAYLIRAIASHRAAGGRVVLATHGELDLGVVETLALSNFKPKRTSAP